MALIFPVVLQEHLVCVLCELKPAVWVVEQFDDAADELFYLPRFEKQNGRVSK
jgi:hypothetical protein